MLQNFQIISKALPFTTYQTLAPRYSPCMLKSKVSKAFADSCLPLTCTSNPFLPVLLACYPLPPFKSIKKGVKGARKEAVLGGTGKAVTPFFLNKNKTGKKGGGFSITLKRTAVKVCNSLFGNSLTSPRELNGGSNRSEVTDPNKFFIVCKKSRIESNTSFYGCFYLGPFDESLSQTLANDLRRTLLSELVGLAITSVEIEGVLHKFSSLPGLKEPVLDFICNLQTVVLKTSLKRPFTTLKQTKKTYTGFLKTRGPRIIKARDLILPAGIQCVDPNQYLATLAEDGILSMKFQINEGKSYVFQKPENLDVSNLKKRNILLYKTKKSKSLLNSNNSEMLEMIKVPSNTNKLEKELTHNKKGVITKQSLQPIPLDAVFMPVTRVNCMIEDHTLATDFNIFQNTYPLLPPMVTPLLTPPSVAPQGLGVRVRGFQEKKNAGFFQKEQSLLFTSTRTFPNDQMKLPPLLSGKALDFITHADVQAQNQTSLFFTNAFCLYKNHLKLNQLYSKIKQQSQLKLIPWYENLAYFSFFVNATSKIPVVPQKKRGVEKTPTSFSYQPAAVKKQPLKGLLPPLVTLTFRTSSKKGLETQPFQEKLFSSPKGVKTLLGSYDFYNYHVSKPNNKNQKTMPSLWISRPYLRSNQQKLNGVCHLKQEFKLPNVAKELLYTEKTPEVNLRTPLSLSPLPLKRSLPTAKLREAGEVGKATKLGTGKVYSYQDYLKIEYSKILKLKPVTKKSHIILEIWTNGSIHPRQALHHSFSFLTNTFLKLQKTKTLGSMFRSELAYGNLNKYYTQMNTLTPSILASDYISTPPTSINLFQEVTFSNQILQKRGMGGRLALSTPNPNLLNPAGQGPIPPKVLKGVLVKPSPLISSLELPIGTLPISLRAYTALRKAQIYTLNHLLDYSRDQLLKTKNFGPKSLFEVEKTLAHLGLSLHP